MLARGAVATERAGHVVPRRGTCRHRRLLARVRVRRDRQSHCRARGRVHGVRDRHVRADHSARAREDDARMHVRPGRGRRERSSADLRPPADRGDAGSGAARTPAGDPRPRPLRPGRSLLRRDGGPGVRRPLRTGGRRDGADRCLQRARDSRLPPAARGSVDRRHGPTGAESEDRHRGDRSPAGARSVAGSAAARGDNGRHPRGPLAPHRPRSGGPRADEAGEPVVQLDSRAGREHRPLHSRERPRARVGRGACRGRGGQIGRATAPCAKVVRSSASAECVAPGQLVHQRI